MAKTITFYQVDRVWYSLEDKKIIGDMAFTFQESDDCRMFDKEELVSNLIDNVKTYEIGDYYKYNDENEVPVYEILKCTYEADDDEKIEDDNDLLNLLHGDIKYEIGELYAICDEEYANKIGLITALKADWAKNTPLHFVSKD